MTPPGQSAGVAGAPTGPEPHTNPLDYPAVDVPPLPEPGTQGPVVALDVDGVINYFPREQPAAPGVYSVPACIPAWATARAEFLVGHGRVNLSGRLTVDHAHGVWIRSLLDRGVTVVWCTSWETAAPVVYGKLLDIPPLPVVQLHPADRPKYTGIECKALALQDLFPRRPLVWLDDHLVDYNPSAWFRHPTWPTFARPVNPAVGIDQSIRDEVDAWVARHADGGQAPVEFLGHEYDSSWRITTDHGTLRLRPDGRVLLGRNLRAHLNIRPGTKVSRGGPIVVGDPLYLDLEERADDGLVLTPDVRSITLLHHHHRDRPVPRYQDVPDLHTAHGTQEAAQLVANALLDPAPTDLVVRQEYLRIPVDDVIVTVELTDRRVVLSVTDAQRTRTTLSDQPASHSSFVTGWRSVLEPAATLRWAIHTYHLWLNQQTCRHRDAGGPYCPDCGHALEDPDRDPGASRPRSEGQCQHGYHHPEWAHACDGCCQDLAPLAHRSLPDGSDTPQEDR